MNNRSEDSVEIYNMMLVKLKQALGADVPNLQAIKLALDFCKMFELDVEANVKPDENVEDYLSTLPFRKKVD